MRITLKKPIREEMQKLFPGNPSFEEDIDKTWKSEKTVDTKFLNEEEILKLQEIYKRQENKEAFEDRRQLRALNALVKMLSGSNTKITNLNSMAEGLVMLMMPYEKHWVFIEDNEVMLPYFVTCIQFHPAKDYSPACIELKGVALRRGKHTELKRFIYREALGKNGCTPGELMEHIGLFLESEELIEEYNKQMEKYRELCAQTGLQLVGHGKCDKDRWSTETIFLDKGGASTKLIVDDLESRESKDSKETASNLWSKKHGEDGEDAEVFSIPTLPFIRVFNLKLHRFMDIHVNNVEAYVYEKGLEDKLVLEDDKRELIDLLVSSGGDDSRDIIQGKSGGVIIVTSGPPGTGKTLTAEVFSEKVERPLYVVQCSQLGTNPDLLEKSLQTVLEQSCRWNAVLLIDEADVYIHERGNDITQNAIVGVFLRVLEYYSGVLFMTTNRACVIDDAIISRCIAHVRYSLPNKSELFALWKILSKQYGVEFSDVLCRELSDKFPGISGRSVKQLIRLSKALCQSRGNEITVASIEWVSKFQNVEVPDVTKDKFPVTGRI